MFYLNILIKLTGGFKILIMNAEEKNRRENERIERKNWRENIW